MTMLAAVLFGGLVGAAFVLLARRHTPQRELALYAAGLVIAALIYVAFALLRHGVSHLPLELLGLVLFTLAAGLGLRNWTIVLGLAWIAHGAWDYVLHVPPPAYVPSWYPVWCLGLDVLVGLYVALNGTRFRVAPGGSIG
jgi:hypothetical protein